MWPKLPKGYPDETLNSIVGRWHATVAGFDSKTTTLRLLGRLRVSDVLITPSLNVIARMSELNSDTLRERHTLFPFYVAFCRSSYPTTRLHSLFDNINLKTNLESQRFVCPRCIESDIFNYGEPYWHRVHQIPHVVVCPHHNVKLIRSCPVCGETLEITDRMGQPLVATHCPRGHSLIDNYEQNADMLLRNVSQACNLLLNKDIDDIDVNEDDLRASYSSYVLTKARKAGLLSQELWSHTYPGYHIHEVLTVPLSKYYGDELFRRIKVDNPLYSSWVKNVLSRSNDLPSNPIYYILIDMYLRNSAVREVAATKVHGHS